MNFGLSMLRVVTCKKNAQHCMVSARINMLNTMRKNWLKTPAYTQVNFFDYIFG